jgi:hypothetical protein
VARPPDTVAPVKRGFWTHQFVEYILGFAAIAAGASSPQPLFPSIAGVLLLFNAASTDGPLGAFKLIPRRYHRLTDDALVVALVLMAIFGGSKVDATARVVLLGCAFVLAFITWQTDYSTKAERAAAAANVDKADQLGRSAGRMAGNVVNTWRHRKPPSGQ